MSTSFFDCNLAVLTGEFVQMLLKFSSTLVTKFAKSLTPVDNIVITFSIGLPRRRHLDYGTRRADDDDAFCWSLFGITQ